VQVIINLFSFFCFPHVRIMVVVVPELIAFDLDHMRENVSVEGTMLVMDSLALEI